ncbi:hypothetical protein ACT4ML_12330 [Natrinema sp. LN54]|uniref:hypothetical protein n=1 Tax=Natrinema sp. LN54 TaxID=3458705 RepID=UPI00403543FA
MSENEKPRRMSRRGVLSAVAGTGVAAAFGTAASNRATGDSSIGDATDGIGDAIDELPLGTFESTLDGWGTDGDLALSRVARGDRPIAVTEGEYALEVATDGESVPTISRPVTDLDLSTHPYFVADVTPGRIDGTDAPVAFRFRLYRPSDLLEDGLTEEPVAESEPVTVPQATPGHVYWDASDIDLGVLDAVSRLEIGWYPADTGSNSSDSPDGTVAYRGGIALDNIRATDSVDPVGRARLAATMRDLQFDRGAYVRTEVLEEFEAGETGAFVFADGETEPYRFETLAADRFLLTVADAEIAFGGGWS